MTRALRDRAMNSIAARSCCPSRWREAARSESTPTQKRRVMSRSSGFSSDRGGDGARFEGHAADGAGTGAGAHDFGMHGAGVFGACGGERDVGLEGHAAGGTGSGLGLAHFGAHGADVRGRASGFRLPGYEYRPRSGGGWHSERYKSGRCGSIQIRLGIGFEFFDAAGAAEVILFSGVFVDVSCGRGIDVHAADGVALGRGGRCHRYWVSVPSPLQGLLNFSCYDTHSLRCAALCRRSADSIRSLSAA